MKKSMKKFLSRLLGFIPISFIAYIILVCVWSEITPALFHKNMFTQTAEFEHTYRRLNEVDSVRNVDILFIGSSHACRGFDTRIFKKAGYTSYNLGTSAQTPIQTKMLLKRYLLKLNPDLIVFEVYPGAFQSDGVRAGMILLSDDQNDWGSVEMAWEIFHIKVYNTLIFGLYQDWFHSKEIIQQPDKLGKDRYVSGGFVERDMETFGYEEKTQTKWNLRQNQIKAFYSIVDMLKKRNIKFILVQAPITKAKYQAYSNNDQFNDKMSKVGEYYNMNEVDEIDLDDSLHFYDSHHLNQKGVESFNKRLLEMIESDSLE